MSTGSDTGDTKGDIVPELEEITSYQWRSQTIPSGISVRDNASIVTQQRGFWLREGSNSIRIIPEKQTDVQVRKGTPEGGQPDATLEMKETQAHTQPCAWSPKN